MSRQLEREDYTIGWICALPLERSAAVAVLDKQHPPLPQDKEDNNAYTFGEIGDYNIVIACLRSGVYGVTSAAIVVTNLCRSFPSITVGLTVGIGGGAPALPHCDIRLGDVVISEPIAGNGGVLQYDFGKTVREGEFIQTGVLNKPPELLLTALSKLKSDYLLYPDKTFNNIVTDLLGRCTNDSSSEGTCSISQTFGRPPTCSDRLFEADYEHSAGDASCDLCDPSKAVARPLRAANKQSYAHYGLIASGNQVMKDGITRDKLSQKNGVLCFEMEAAGVMDKLPSLVVRGICDYSDSHKHKIWQPYAALAAAAFAKDLILRLPLIAKHEARQTQRYKIELPVAEGAEFGSYEDQHEPTCLLGTRTDLLHRIAQWVENPQGKCMYWMYGMAGTGKSTISRTVARSLQAKGHLGASFFFKRSEADRSNGARFFTTIALQLADRFKSLRSSIHTAIEVDPRISKKSLKEQFDKLIFDPLSKLNFGSQTSKLVLVVLVDALDECEAKNDVQIIIHLLARLKDIQGVNMRVFVTSRLDLPILPTFKRLLKGTYEDLVLHEVPKIDIEHDITLFLKYEFSMIAKDHNLPSDWPGDENRRH
ncbi:hypothetical protein TWF694_008442 [Orbilia ellipsospora]|uniref:Nephrocystin 3-like N-terminal domain-containing protein n=1 Tax=Orbilia ellipsospora TaxID=2528407 RepID=A0AAV9XH20_9PEZI